MPELLIQTKNGKIYRAQLPVNFMVAEKYDLDFDEILKVGFVTKNREVWVERKPH